MMTEKDKFEKMLEVNTRDGFHDAELTDLSILLSKNILILSIEHPRDINESGDDFNILLCKLEFFNISKIQIDDPAENLFTKNDVSIIKTEMKNENLFIGVEGIGGWMISFECSYFKYSEKIVRQYKGGMLIN